MEKLLIKAKKDSPDILFNPENNEFSIKGVCHPENVTKFFIPVIRWLDEYILELKKTGVKKPIKVIFFFRYFNSATYKFLISLLQKINEFSSLSIPISVEWHYEFEDEDMKESGVELFEFSGIKIPYECIQSNFPE